MAKRWQKSTAGFDLAARSRGTSDLPGEISEIRQLIGQLQGATEAIQRQIGDVSDSLTTLGERIGDLSRDVGLIRDPRTGWMGQVETRFVNNERLVEGLDKAKLPDRMTTLEAKVTELEPIKKAWERRWARRLGWAMGVGASGAGSAAATSGDTWHNFLKLIGRG